MSTARKGQDRRRTRPRARPGDYRTSRAVARRTDLFANTTQPDRKNEIVESEIRYASGTTEGVLRVWADPRARLDGHALALFTVLCERFVNREAIKITVGVNSYWAVTATPRELALAVYGRADGRAYRYLGLTRDERHPGALQALKMTLIQARSTWLTPDGQRQTVTEGFSLIDYYRWAGDKDAGQHEGQILIALSGVVQRELVNGGQTLIPGELLRKLGPKHDTAMRIAYHVLSQAPLYEGVRRIGAQALVPIIAPPPSRDPDRYPGRYLAYLRRLIATIDRADNQHCWRWETGKHRLGNIVCEDQP